MAINEGVRRAVLEVMKMSCLVLGKGCLVMMVMVSCFSYGDNLSTLISHNDIDTCSAHRRACL